VTLLSYNVDAAMATITMDDGKANALSPAMLDELGAALDRAESGSVGAVVLAGRPGRFSGGFDLGVLRAGGAEAQRMLRGGFALAERLLSFPCPIVMACTGHAVAMGLFLVCSGDYRIGANGDFKLQANEVAIGLTMPYPALAILRYRLTPWSFDRAVGLAETFTPADAIDLGLLDRLADPDAVVPVAQEVAASFLMLDASAHAASKLRARAALLSDLRAGIDADYPETPAAS
jgi:enoyl-CoA hydratase/carnithine racemase